jgi:hypothetical protein
MSKLKTLLANPCFIAIVGMLGSDGPGEAANAAAKATKMLADAGVTWAELLAAQGGGKGSRGDDVMQAELYRTRAQLQLAHRAEEIAGIRAKKAERMNYELRKQLDAHKDMVASLEAALKKANDQRPKMGFPDADKVSGTTPTWEDDFTPKTPTEIRRWLGILAGQYWADLNEWEINYFTDFIENKKAILTAKQYGIFKRTATKVGLPLDF